MTSNDSRTPLLFVSLVLDVQLDVIALPEVGCSEESPIEEEGEDDELDVAQLLQDRQQGPIDVHDADLRELVLHVYVILQPKRLLFFLVAERVRHTLVNAHANQDEHAHDKPGTQGFYTVAIILPIFYQID